jgi:hypothetical protein
MKITLFVKMVGLASLVNSELAIKIVTVMVFVKTEFVIAIKDSLDNYVILQCAKILVHIRVFVVWELVFVMLDIKGMSVMKDMLFMEKC